MSFIPRYPQPFTLEQAFGLDVPIISEEISRLENSLEHLRETQDLLQEHIVATGGNIDTDINDALKENESVIGSQEERIEMLKMALRDKGITSTAHYQPSRDKPSNGMEEGPTLHADDEDEGIHL